MFAFVVYLWLLVIRFHVLSIVFFLFLTSFGHFPAECPCGISSFVIGILSGIWLLFGVTYICRLNSSSYIPALRTFIGDTGVIPCSRKFFSNISCGIVGQTLEMIILIAGVIRRDIVSFLSFIWISGFFYYYILYMTVIWEIYTDTAIGDFWCQSIAFWLYYFPDRFYIVYYWCFVNYWEDAELLCQPLTVILLLLVYWLWSVTALVLFLVRARCSFGVINQDRFFDFWVWDQNNI